MSQLGVMRRFYLLCPKSYETHFCVAMIFHSVTFLHLEW